MLCGSSGKNLKISDSVCFLFVLLSLYSQQWPALVYIIIMKFSETAQCKAGRPPLYQHGGLPRNSALQMSYNWVPKTVTKPCEATFENFPGNSFIKY